MAETKEISKTAPDPLDRRILQLLEVDARKSYSALAKELRVPEETVRYRVKNLLSSGAILSFFTIIDAGKLGNSYFKVCLKLVSVTQQALERLTTELAAHQSVNWVARFEGVYDIGFTIRVQRAQQLDLFLRELKRKYHSHLSRITIAINLEVDFLVRDYLNSKSARAGRGAAYTAPVKEVELDSLDVEILRSVSTDPREAVTKTAATLEVSPQTIVRHLRRLEDLGVIKRYSILPDYRKLGLANYYVFVYLNQVPEKRVNDFLADCKALPEVVYVVKALGEWDFELNIEASSFAAYHEAMMLLTKRHEGTVRDYLGLPVHQVYKLTLTP